MPVGLRLERRVGDLTGCVVCGQYHFYEEIGKGKHSVVYRCRKKKCVEFCAIKSVDKVSRSVAHTLRPVPPTALPTAPVVFTEG